MGQHGYARWSSTSGSQNSGIVSVRSPASVFGGPILRPVRTLSPPRSSGSEPDRRPGRTIGVVAGAALLVVLRDGLVAVNVNAYYQSMVVASFCSSPSSLTASGSDASNTPGGASVGRVRRTRRSRAVTPESPCLSVGGER